MDMQYASTQGVFLLPQSLPQLLPLPRAQCQQGECSTSPGVSNKALSTAV